MTERVLLVDDDEQMPRALERGLGRVFPVTTALPTARAGDDAQRREVRWSGGRDAPQVVTDLERSSAVPRGGWQQAVSLDELTRRVRRPSAA